MSVLTFISPITSPYDFNLGGGGGLLALNRSMDVEVPGSGLKNRTQDSFWFPENRILNANKVISDSELMTAAIAYDGFRHCKRAPPLCHLSDRHASPGGPLQWSAKLTLQR